MSNSEIDFVFLSMPKMSVEAPSVGPALLKTVLNEHNISSMILDLNIEFFNYLNNLEQDLGYHYYEKDDSAFFLDRYPKFVETIVPISEKFWKQKVKEILKLKPKFVGLSLLSEYSHCSSIYISKLIKKADPNIIIVWGGTGVLPRYIERIIRLHGEYEFIDFYVEGDGEKAIIELINTYKTSETKKYKVPIVNLESIPLPDYSDIKWDIYRPPGEHKPIYVTGSRGCVKRCDFCNVYEIWPKYIFRSGESIANEIIYCVEKYDRNMVLFTDSLINGSMKHFRNLCSTLKDYNTKNEKKIQWSSQWIVRSQHQMTRDDYVLMKDSGCTILEIGVESFCEDIRWEMGKKFTDEDMWFCFDTLKDLEIRQTFLMIVGYVTETEQHHQHTLDTVRKLFERGHAEHIEFSFGNILHLGTGMPVYDKFKDEITHYNDHIDWTYKDNSLEVRERRLYECRKLVDELNEQYYRKPKRNDLISVKRAEEDINTRKNQ
jgi:radical SAM superfamily enzyme YgiQ (UPF0313 family)